MKKLLPYILIFVLVAGGAFVYIKFFNNKTETVKAATYFSYSPGDYFLTNVKDSKSLLKTTIVFKVVEENKEEQEAFLTENEHVIRDQIVFLLREKTYEELSSADIHDKLSDEIIEKVQEKLGVEYLKAVYFKEYVLQ